MTLRARRPSQAPRTARQRAVPAPAGLLVGRWMFWIFVKFWKFPKFTEGGGGGWPAGRPKLRNLVRAGSAGLPSRPRARYTAVLQLNTIAYSRSALCTNAWELEKLKFRKSWKFHRNLKEIFNFLGKLRKAAAEQSRWCLQLGSLSTKACTLHTCRPAARRTAR